jgi:hypothetical protein
VEKFHSAARGPERPKTDTIVSEEGATECQGGTHRSEKVETSVSLVINEDGGHKAASKPKSTHLLESNTICRPANQGPVPPVSSTQRMHQLV